MRKNAPTGVSVSKKIPKVMPPDPGDNTSYSTACAHVPADLDTFDGPGVG